MLFSSFSVVILFAFDQFIFLPLSRKVHDDTLLMFLICLLSKDNQEKVPQTDEAPLIVDDQVSGPSIFNLKF